MDDSSHPVTRSQRIYVLRLWRAEPPDLSWRASLENPRSGERIGFENLESLFAFLMDATEQNARIEPAE